MKGLLIKDMINMKRMLRTYLALFVFYLVFAIATKSTSIMGTICMLVSIMFPISSISLDESYHWNELVYSMPVSKKTVVLSKYVQAILLTVISVVCCIGIVAVIHAIYPLPETFAESALSVAAVGVMGLLVVNLILPLLLKFGVEKGRILMMLCMMLPLGAAILFADRLEALAKLNGAVLLALFLALIAVSMVVSVFLSIRICEKKEY